MRPLIPTCWQTSSADTINHTAGRMFLEYNIHNFWQSLEAFKWGHNVKDVRERQYGFWNLPFKIHLHVYCLMFLLPIREWIYWMKGQICSQFLTSVKLLLIYTGVSSVQIRWLFYCWSQMLSVSDMAFRFLCRQEFFLNIERRVHFRRVTWYLFLTVNSGDSYMLHKFGGFFFPFNLVMQ